MAGFPDSRKAMTASRISSMWAIPMPTGATRATSATTESSSAAAVSASVKSRSRIWSSISREAMGSSGTYSTSACSMSTSRMVWRGTSSRFMYQARAASAPIMTSRMRAMTTQPAALAPPDFSGLLIRISGNQGMWGESVR